MGRWIVQGLLPALAGAALMLAVIAGGRWARERLRGEGVAFADIDCPPPPERTREDFLTEVQYLSGLPDRLDALSGDAPQRLAEAFARHPWVEEVKRVEVGPERRIKADLVYRTPVLAVPLKDGKALRAVDRHGVLLPGGRQALKVPRFAGQPKPPAGPPGARWGDEGVEAAARLADFLTPHLDRLCPQGPERLEIRFKDDALVAGGGRGGSVIWGRPPGQEKEGERTAEVKLQRWLKLGVAAAAPSDLRKRSDAMSGEE
jgi:hypothetical protein